MTANHQVGKEWNMGISQVHERIAPVTIDGMTQRIHELAQLP